MIRGAALFFFLLWIAPVSAQSYTPPCIQKIVHLAHRLNVKPTKEPSLLVVQSCDGRSYDIVAILNAFIDRMDKSDRASRR